MTARSSIFDLTTDKSDYAPGEFARLTVTGVSLGDTVEFQVLHVSAPGEDAIYGTAHDTLSAGPGEPALAATTFYRANFENRGIQT